MIFIGDLEPYRKEISGKRKKQYQRLLAQADRYKTMVLPEEHPKESTTYMGIAIPNLALAYCSAGTRNICTRRSGLSAPYSLMKMGQRTFGEC